ncbi:hypothetical protein COOONC_09031 [Cooperia oncophora]
MKISINVRAQQQCFPERHKARPCLNELHIQYGKAVCDLTLMMTKYQIQSVVMPEQILTVTMNTLVA